METKKKALPAWVILMMICAGAGLLLGIVNAVTQGPIAEGTAAAANEARRTLFPDADRFEIVEVGADSGIMECFEAYAGDTLLGHVARLTVAGSQADIEVTVGIKPDDSLSGIQVGGASFAETAGLGAKIKDEPFRSQFVDLKLPAALNENVDAITSATISSRAVVDAVNKAAEFVAAVR